MIRSFAALAMMTAASTALANSALADEIAAVSATLDYTKEDDAAADAFFDALNANAGKAIDLKLEIVPRQDAASLDYSLRQNAPSPSDKDIVCGTENYGLIDNVRSTFTLSFQHPRHFHSPVEIVIGDRLNYPFHTIRCGVEEHTSKERTHLHLVGKFVVVTADIPTAVSYHLFPYKP